MKFYLRFPLFFLGACCLPIAAFTQENPPDQHPLPSEVPSYNSLPSDQQSDIEFKNYPEPNETSNPWQRPVERESDTFQTKFFNMLFILGLLIGFMMLASWALKRMMKSKMTNLNTSSSIKLLETRYLSPRATLYLVEVQDKTFLIAESPTAVSHLATLSLEGEPPVEEEFPAPSQPLRPFSFPRSSKIP